MENLIKNQAVDVIDSREREKQNGNKQRLQVIWIIVLIMISAPMLCLTEAPILAAQRQHESIVQVQGKEAVQIKIPVITDIFGVYEFIYANQEIGVGCKHPVMRKEKVSNTQPYIKVYL